MSAQLIVFLHGVGSNGNDLAPLAGNWRELLPDTGFASPDAPFPFDHGPGYQWFSITGVTEGNRSQRVEAAREQFDETLKAIMDEHGLRDRPEQVALVGFSQGAIMALDAVASGRWSLAAVVAFSGRLSSPAPLTPAAGVPVMLMHGALDPVIPPAETERAAATLDALGVKVTSRILPRLGHTISAEGIAAAGRFIADALGTRR